MNVMFLTIENVKSFKTRSIYMDLVNKFIEKGHYVTILSACENKDRLQKEPMYYIYEDKGEIIKVHTMNVTKVSNYLAKGIGVILLLPQFRIAALKAMKKRKYDLVLYGSPPITVVAAIKAVKKKQGAYSYLLLKDIWPYDCLFGDALTQSGWKKVAFNYLAYLARNLYSVTDTIGCMSPANVKFLLENEPQLEIKKIEVNPNSIEPFMVNLKTEEVKQLREKYGIPTDKVIFVYGGNLGVPQGIDFALASVEASQNVDDSYFVFIGGGTEREKIERIAEERNLNNFSILPGMLKDEYETLVFACDVGLVFLNHACLSPNYPSRLLAYMQASLPVLCATDTYTDVGKIAEKYDYGLWCESSETAGFVNCVKELCNGNTRKRMGNNAKRFLVENYTVEHSYNLIAEKMNVKENY